MITKALIDNGTTVLTAGASKATGALDYANGFSSLITAWKDYKITHELEVTRRTQIAADRDVRLEAIRGQAQAIQSFIQATFAERAHNFDKFFTLLDQGFASGNDTQINAALTLIVEQTKISPMAQAAQLMSSINDPNIDSIEI